MKPSVLGMILILALALSSCSLNGKQTPKDTKAPVQNEYEMNQVKQLVKINQSQLTKLYTRHSAIIAQYGTLQITLYITEKGAVADAVVEPKSGRFSTALLRDIKNKVLEWKFDNKNKLIYTFSLRLSKD